jgi:translocation and assembly module TamA
MSACRENRFLLGCISLAVMHLATPVNAQTPFANPIQTGVRGAVNEARSANFLTPATIEQRVEAAQTFLRSEGYYGAEIEVLEAISANQPRARDSFLVEIPNDTRQLKIKLGPVFVIQSPQITIDGPPLPEFEAARKQAAVLVEKLAQEPARASEILRVQSQTLVTLKDAGFTQAEDVYPDIIVDHATKSINVTYTLKAGPLTQLGEVIVTGADRTPAKWVQDASAVPPGAIATGERLRRISERARLTGAYNSVDIDLGTPQTINPNLARADIALEVEERTRRIWSAGAEWSTSDGLGVDASTSFFHLLNRADTLTFDGRIGTLDTSLGASVKLPSFRGAGRDLQVSARAGQETTDAFDRLIGRLAAVYTLPRGRKDVLTYGLGLDFTRTDTPQNIPLGLNSRDVDGADLSALIRYERDRADDILSPTSGWRASGEVQPSVFIGDSQTIPYGRAVLAASYYRPFSALPNGVIAMRAKIGVLITDDDALPFDRRFFAGGGGSVRGYGFQSIGPRDVNDNPLGGRSVLEAAVEARWSLRGPLGIAVFSDAARVGALDGSGAQETRVGVGVGLRYNLGLAPLRLDLAVPVSKRDGDPPVQLYISAGQSF